MKKLSLALAILCVSSAAMASQVTEIMTSQSKAATPSQVTKVMPALEESSSESSNVHNLNLEIRAISFEIKNKDAYEKFQASGDKSINKEFDDGFNFTNEFSKYGILAFDYTYNLNTIINNGDNRPIRMAQKDGVNNREMSTSFKIIKLKDNNEILLSFDLGMEKTLIIPSSTSEKIIEKEITNSFRTMQVVKLNINNKYKMIASSYSNSDTIDEKNKSVVTLIYAKVNQ